MTLILIIIYVLILLRTHYRHYLHYTKGKTNTCYNIGQIKGLYCIDYVRKHKEANIKIIEHGFIPISPILGTGHYHSTKRVELGNLWKFLKSDAVYLQDNFQNERRCVIFAICAIILSKTIININQKK